MNELIERVLQETQRLSKDGESCSYLEFVELVELRQLLTDEVEKKRDAMTDAQKERIRELKHMDAAILGHMQRLKDEASQALNQLNGSKLQRKAYQNEVEFGSILFDKRK
ncbi:hypothetical protein ACF3MZ_21125 [Paenibacillaceae bacterium WGS1546]|uniref:hypothetical protein n=1 Tax=Cohnella sp. WGS1546 TaxID=3366810 RepID=UPI00372D44E9